MGCKNTSDKAVEDPQKVEKKEGGDAEKKEKKDRIGYDRNAEKD